MEEPYKLPEGWVWTRLGEILDRVKGKKPKLLGLKSDVLTAPYIDIEAFERKVFKAYTDGKDCPLCERDDILIVWDGARCGLVGSGVEGVIGSTLAKLDHYELNPSYLFYFLQTQYDLINKNPRGVGIPHIEPNIFWNISFPLSPLAEQQRIISKLEALLSQVNASKEHLAKIQPLIKQFRQSMLAAARSGQLTEDWRREHPDVKPARELLENIFRRRLDEADTPAKEQRIKDIYSYREEQDSVLLPPGWEYIALDKLCKSFQYGSSKKSMPEGKIPVLRMGNLQNGEIDWNALVYTYNEEEIEKYSLEPGNVLFNRTNSPELVGKTAIYRGERPATFAGYLIRINNYQELDSEYLNYCLNTTQAKEHCLRVKTDGVSQSNINAQKLGKFEIPFCSLEEQQEIVRCVDTLFKVVKSIEDRYNKANSQVDNLTKSLLAKAFRGELVPRDPNDEPASILLERIKQARAKKEKGKKAQKRKSKTLLDFN